MKRTISIQAEIKVYIDTYQLIHFFFICSGLVFIVIFSIWFPLKRDFIVSTWIGFLY